MNILLIDHYAGSPRYGMEYRPYYLAREWVKMGHDVTIVGGSYSHLRIQQPNIERRVTEEDIEGVRYVWLKTPRYRGNGSRRVLSMFSFIGGLWRNYKSVVGAFPPDAVIASSTYPLDIFPAYRIAKKYQAKLVFEVHDLWPLTPVSIGGMSRRHPFIVMLQYAENYAYRKSDHVVSMLPNAYEHMQHHGLARKKFVYIPNGIDVGDWREPYEPVPQPHADCLKRLRGEGRFVVGYLGGHQPSNAMDTVLDAAEMLQDSPVAFMLVGSGSEKERLQARARDRGLSNVVFLPPVAKACVPGILAATDVLYVGFTNRPIFRFGISPNKLLDYMMAGKPVILSVDSANDLVAESGCGISCHGEDAVGVVDAVRRLMAISPDERAAMGNRGKDYVMLHHQYPSLARRFAEVLAESKP
jgi:glycosyltransferase involved in cell wall biosynthesis